MQSTKRTSGAYRLQKRSRRVSTEHPGYWKVFEEVSITLLTDSIRKPSCYTSLTASPMVTLYSYDTLGNLLCVEQHGNATNGTGCNASASSDATSPWRVRRFTYDSLSRLLTATNPESGTISYSYDADGNVLQKTSPAPNQTGTATQIISYCYDALNRVTGQAYAAQGCPLSSPVISYAYDGGANGIGQLTSLLDQAGSGSYSYDALGRIASEKRTIAGIQKNLSYTYNLDGSVATLTYPSGEVVTYTPDSAGRMLSAVDSGNNINYVTGASYGPDSSLTGFVSGSSSGFSGISNSWQYNRRLQICRIAALTSGSSPTTCSDGTHTGDVLDLGYNVNLGNGDNGNVVGITNYKDTTRSQSFTYDALNRLMSAQNAGTNCSQMTANGASEYWGNSYSYDAWGNLLSKSVTKCSAESLSVAALANNQLSGYGYDAAGNMTYDATTGNTFTFDAENRITGAVGYTYTYDIDGNRVEKSNGSTGTIYWSMSPGIVAESDLAGNLQSEYVFFDGERVARKDFPSGALSYYFSDHLKTASVITNSAGTITADEDYYPWGGELEFINRDSNHYKFTGKERDNETGLDYFGARYYGNALGRFLSPDWEARPAPVPYAHLDDPQSLNLYSYVENDPLSHADSDGHAGKEIQLSGKYTARIDKNNPNDMPNVHVSKGGNEVARGRVNPETDRIEWEGELGASIRAEVDAVARQKGLYEAARQRIADIRRLRSAGGSGEEGGTGGLARALVILQVIGLVTDAIDRAIFNQHESETGLKIDNIGVTHVTDLSQVTQTAPIGSQITTALFGGLTYTLGQDRVWRDKYGRKVSLCQSKGGAVHECGA